MLTLFENGFSPFARKVRMVLEYKGLEYSSVDGLAKKNREQLVQVNGRVEVPVLVHDDLVISNSSDIVAYLERVFPTQPVYPDNTKQWANARAWERCSDSVIDAILINISYWFWAKREDTMPDGLLDAARNDLNEIFAALENQLTVGPFLCGPLSIADFSLFPHFSSMRILGVGHDAQRHPQLHAWYKRVRELKVFTDDLDRTKAYVSDLGASDIEREKIFWRGDRIEWILAKGFHSWFHSEITNNRVLWPGLGIPHT